MELWRCQSSDPHGYYVDCGVEISWLSDPWPNSIGTDLPLVLSTKFDVEQGLLGISMDW